jgi:hypothetical protein
VGSPPVNTVQPSIAVPGDWPREDMLLKVDNGTWSGTGPFTYSYAWESCTTAGVCSSIGSNQNTYRLTATELGKSIRVKVTAQTPGGGQSVTAQVTRAVATARPTIANLTGFEHRTLSQAGFGLTDLLTGNNGTNLVLDTVNVRSGTTSLRSVCTAGGAGEYLFWPNSGSALVSRFAIRISTTPVADYALAAIFDTGSVRRASFGWSTAASRPGMRWNAGTVTPWTLGAVDPSRWYVIDMRADYSGATTNTITWSVDGIPQEPVTLAVGGATTVGGMALGTQSANCGYVANYDDWSFSLQANDYPIGDGQVLGHNVDGAGTHVTPAHFLNGDNSAINAVTPTLVDEIPFGSLLGTDHFKQINWLAGPGSYLETTLSNQTLTANARALRGLMAYRSAGTGANGETCVLDQTGINSSISDASCSAALFTMNPGATLTFKGNMLAQPQQGGWNPFDVNALVIRSGFSSNATGANYAMWDGLMLEADYPAVENTPVATSKPTISGTVQMAQTVTANLGNYANAPYAYTYQWYRCTGLGGIMCNNPIPGATGQTYTIAAPVVAGNFLRVGVYGWNDSGRGSVMSDATVAVAP